MLRSCYKIKLLVNFEHHHSSSQAVVVDQTFQFQVQDDGGEMRPSTNRRPTASGISLEDLFSRPSLAHTNPLHNNPSRTTSNASNKNAADDRNESNTKADPFGVPMLYDSILVYFNGSVFAQQLAIHLLPFGFLLSPNMLAQGMIGSWIGILFHIVQPLIFYMMICTFPFSGASRVYINGCLWIAVIYFLEQKIMLSVKYACLTPSEYERIMTCQDAQLIAVYQEQMNLISSWLEREETVLQFELGAASIRVGINMSHVYFSVPGLPKDSVSDNRNSPISSYQKAKEASKRSQFHFWNAFLRGHLIIDTSTLPAKELIPREDNNNCNSDDHDPGGDDDHHGYYLSISAFCSTLIRRSDEINYMSIKVTKGIVSHLVLLVLIPVILLFLHSKEVSVEVLVTQVMYILVVNSMTYSFGYSVQRILYTSLFGKSTSASNYYCLSMRRI
jgi:hypothetical protein